MSSAIRIGYVERSSQKAAAVEVENALVQQGHQILRQRGNRSEMFETLLSGDLDLLVSAWLPDSDSDLAAQSDDRLVQLGSLYEPRHIWGVPHYMPQSDIATISDLLDPGVIARLGSCIETIADRRLAHLSRSAMEIYGLDQAGYRFREVAEDDRIGRFVEDVAEQKWAIIPIWQPHWLHHRYGIRALSDPLGALGPAEQAILMASRATIDRLDADTITTLSSLHFANDYLNELDDHLQPWE